MQQYLERKRPARIADAEWDELAQALAPISESHLRRLLRESGVPLSPLVEGVRQEDFAALERTLLALLEIYGSDPARARACRRAVITAKDHAKWVLRNPRAAPEKREQKEEMVLWMLTWLENPPVFPSWLALRRKVRAAGG